MPPALLLAGLLPMATLAQPAAKFTSAEGKFAAAFPGTPTETKKPITSGSQHLMFQTKFEDPAGARLVLWNHITAKGYDPAKILTGFAQGVAQRGRVVSDKPTTFGPDKLPARDLTADTPDGYRMRTLAVVANDRLYQVTVIGSNEFVAGDEAEAFRKSFGLLK